MWPARSISSHDTSCLLSHQLVHVGSGDERVVDHDDGGACRLEGTRDERELVLAEPVLVTAVDEEVHGRRAPARREKHVERFAGMGSVGDVEPRPLSVGTL